MTILLTDYLSGEMLHSDFWEISPNTTMGPSVGRPHNQHAVLEKGDNLNQSQYQGFHSNEQEGIWES